MRRLIKTVLRHRGILSLIVFLGVSFLLFLPGSEIPKVDVSIPGLDKIAHAGMFSVLSFTIGFDYYSRRLVKPNFSQNLSLFVLFLSYAILSEIIQDKFSHRNGNWPDVIADTVGIIIGLSFLQLFGLRIYRYFQSL